MGKSRKSALLNNHKVNRKRPEGVSGNEASFACPSYVHAIPAEAAFCTHCGDPIPAAWEKEPEEKLKRCLNCENAIPCGGVGAPG